MDGRRKGFSQLGQFSREDFQYQAVKIASQARHNDHHPRRHPLAEADVEVEDGSKAVEFVDETEDLEDDDIPDRWQEGEESDGGVSEVSWKNPYAEVGKFPRAVEVDASRILNSATAPGAEVARESGAGGGADTDVESHQERFPALEFLDLPTPDDEEQSAGDHDDRSREPRAGRDGEVAEDDAVVFEEGVDDYELDWGRERSSGGEEEEEDHQHMDEKEQARGFSMADLVRLEHTRAASGGGKQRPLSVPTSSSSPGPGEQRRLPRRERLLKTDAARKARVEALLLQRDGEKETQKTTFESTREKPEQDDGEANERSAEIARLKAELGLPPLEVEDEARGRGWSAGADKAGGSGGITGGRGGEKGDISDSESCSHDAEVWAGATGTGGRGGDDRDSKAEGAGAPIPLDEDFGKSDVDADEEEEDESHDGAEETGGDDEDPYFGKSDVEEEQDVEGEVEEDPYLGKSEVEVAEEAAEKVVEAGELGGVVEAREQVGAEPVYPAETCTSGATETSAATAAPEPSSRNRRKNVSPLLVPGTDAKKQKVPTLPTPPSPAPEASEKQSQQMNENVSYVSKQHVELQSPETEVATTDFPALFYPEPSFSDTVPVQQNVNVSHGAKQPDENESDSAQPPAPRETQPPEICTTTTSRRLQRALALKKKREETHARMLSEKQELLSDHFESSNEEDPEDFGDEEDAEQFESSPDQVKWLSSHIMGSANSSRQPSTSRQPLLLGPATPVDECVVSAGGRRRNSLRKKSGPTKTGPTKTVAATSRRTRARSTTTNSTTASRGIFPTRRALHTSSETPEPRGAGGRDRGAAHQNPLARRTFRRRSRGGETSSLTTTSARGEEEQKDSDSCLEKSREKRGEKVLFPRSLDSLRLDDAPLDPPGTRVNVRPEQVWGEREVRKLLERKQRKWSRKYREYQVQQQRSASAEVRADEKLDDASEMHYSKSWSPPRGRGDFTTARHGRTHVGGRGEVVAAPSRTSSAGVKKGLTRLHTIEESGLVDRSCSEVKVGMVEKCGEFPDQLEVGTPSQPFRLPRFDSAAVELGRLTHTFRSWYGPPFLFLVAVAFFAAFAVVVVDTSSSVADQNSLRGGSRAGDQSDSTTQTSSNAVEGERRRTVGENVQIVVGVVGAASGLAVAFQVWRFLRNLKRLAARCDSICLRSIEEHYLTLAEEAEPHSKTEKSGGDEFSRHYVGALLQALRFGEVEASAAWAGPFLPSGSLRSESNLRRRGTRPLLLPATVADASAHDVLRQTFFGCGIPGTRHRRRTSAPSSVPMFAAAIGITIVFLLLQTLGVVFIFFHQADEESPADPALLVVLGVFSIFLGTAAVPRAWTTPTVKSYADDRLEKLELCACGYLDALRLFSNSSGPPSTTSTSFYEVEQRLREGGLCCCVTKVSSDEGDLETTSCTTSRFAAFPIDSGRWWCCGTRPPSRAASLEFRRILPQERCNLKLVDAHSVVCGSGSVDHTPAPIVPLWMLRFATSDPSDFRSVRGQSEKLERLQFRQLPAVPATRSFGNPPSSASVHLEQMSTVASTSELVWGIKEKAAAAGGDKTRFQHRGVVEVEMNQRSLYEGCMRVHLLEFLLDARLLAATSAAFFCQSSLRRLAAAAARTRRTVSGFRETEEAQAVEVVVAQSSSFATCGTGAAARFSLRFDSVADKEMFESRLAVSGS